MRWRTSGAAVLAVAVATAVLVASPASAQDKKRGDASPDAPSAYDFTSVSVDNTTETYSLVVKVVDLKRSVGRLDAVIGSRSRPAVYLLHDIPISQGRTSTRLLLRSDGSADAVRVACDGLRAARGTTVDKIRVQIPRSCMPELTSTVALFDLALYPKGGRPHQGDDLRSVVTTRRD